MAAEDKPGDLVAGDTELEFEPLPRSVPKKRRGLRLFLLVLLLAGAGGGAWHYLGGGLAVDGQSRIPLIRAQKSPVKVRPESPGGMQVPDQDKVVYERMQGRAEPPRPERLLPPPEAPLPPPSARTRPAEAGQAASAQRTETPAPVPPSTPGTKAPDAEEPAVAQPEPAPPPAVPTTNEVLAAKPPPPPPAAPQPEMTPKTPLMPESAPPAKEAAAGGYKVQLAAVRAPGRAKEEWERLREKHPDLLGALELSVIKVDLGSPRGVFYRVRAGPIDGADAARALCAKLARRKVGCLVVPPKG